MFYSNRLHTLDTLCDYNQPLRNGLLVDTPLTESVVWFRVASKLPIKLATEDYMRASAGHFPRQSRVSWHLRLDRGPL